MNNFGSTGTLVKYFIFAFAMAGTIGVIGLRESAAQEAAPVYEIRSYHIDPAFLGDYRTWISTHGLPHIRQKMDVVGFWIDGGIEPEVSGAPLDSLGSPNVTWVIRWDSKAERDEVMGEVFSTPEWSEIFSKFPGGSSAYRRVEIRFFDAL